MSLLSDLLASGVVGQTEIMVLMVTLPMGVILLLVVAFLGENTSRQLSRRIDKILANHRVGKSALKTMLAKRDKKKNASQTLEQLAKTLLPRPEILLTRLERAGLSWSLGIYFAISVIVGSITFGSAMLIGAVPIAAALLAALASGLGLPHMIVGFLIGRRKKRFIDIFPEAIDLMIRGVKSGLPIAESIKNAAQESADPVGTELQKMTDGIKLGRKLNEVLWEAAKRLELPEFNFFMISLTIQSETGGNLAETLGNLSNVLRGRRQLKRKVKALSSEAKTSAYIIGSLPFIMTLLLYVMNEEYIMKLFTDPLGQAMVGFALFMIACGTGVMYRMCKFEI